MLLLSMFRKTTRFAHSLETLAFWSSFAFVVRNSSTLRGLYIALGPNLAKAGIFFSSEIVFLINFCQLVCGNSY